MEGAGFLGEHSADLCQCPVMTRGRNPLCFVLSVRDNHQSETLLIALALIDHVVPGLQPSRPARNLFWNLT